MAFCLRGNTTAQMSALINVYESVALLLLCVDWDSGVCFSLGSNAAEVPRQMEVLAAACCHSCQAVCVCGRVRCHLSVVVDTELGRLPLCGLSLTNEY